MSPKVDAFVDKYGWQILVVLVGFVVAWTRVQAAVSTKAEITDVQRIERKVDDVRYLLCKMPENTNDSVCRK